MKKLLFTLIFLPLAACGYAATGIEALLVQLDSCLAQKKSFDKAKEARIATLRGNLQKARTDELRYQANQALFEEYKSYHYDSAYACARHMQELAARVGNRGYGVEADCNVVFCLLSAGLYKEAFDTMEGINIAGLGEAKYRHRYHATWTRLYYDIADYNHAEPYMQEYVNNGNVSTDSCLTYLPEQSLWWYYSLGQRQMKNRDFAASLSSFERVLSMPDVDTHTKAIAYSCIGWINWVEGREDEAISNLARSAINDLQSSTKETTALCALANILYKRGDITRATQYVQSSLADANFYGARQRKIEIGDILPIIEQNRYETLRNESRLLTGGIVLAVLLVAALGVAYVLIRRRNSKLHEAHQIIDERNRSLQRTNEQLQEADKIKDEYIGKSFYINAEYIKKVEKIYKTIDRKIATRQFEDLRSSLKESSINAERESMYEAFDETFLKLFPDFVEKYNALFAEKDRRQPRDDKSLTTEMRIFALIRLGINDSDRIASFLDYSVHTINTYKTRIKNKAVIRNEDFEKSIMEI